PEEEKGTIFVLSKYNDVGLRGTATSIILNCDSKPQEITSAKSFKIFKKLPGVYFYTDAGCNDISSATRKTSSVGSFGENFKKSINCLEISNGPNEQYGFILFKKNSGFKGEFNYENLNEIACYPQAAIRPYRISLENYSAIAIYKINEDPKSAGSSVEFYSQANSSGISKTITAGDIKIKMQATVSEKAYWLAKKIIFDDTNAIEKNRCKSEDTRWQGAFSICAGSMNINGKYLVLLRSSDPTITGGKDYYCQLFTSNDLWSVSGQTDHHKAAATMTYNLEAEYIISKSWAGKNDSLDDVFIIPVYSF
ncbi:hypothetical protein KKC00_01205, partial [Patescibacteria group bacterium]|nr:hypothetical protein [Patescibacteria group bacterium]